MIFTVEDILRYALSGAIGLLVGVVLFCPGQLTVATVSQVSAAAIPAFLILSATLGGAVYSIHRTIIYPFIYRSHLTYLWNLGHFMPISRKTLGGGRPKLPSLNPYRKSDLEIALDRDRVVRSSWRHSAQAGLSGWGAQIHFIYCSLHIIAGEFILYGYGALSWLSWILIAAVLLLLYVLTFLANYRLVVADSSLFMIRVTGKHVRMHTANG